LLAQKPARKQGRLPTSLPSVGYFDGHTIITAALAHIFYEINVGELVSRRQEHDNSADFALQPSNFVAAFFWLALQRQELQRTDISSVDRAAINQWLKCRIFGNRGPVTGPPECRPIPALGRSWGESEFIIKYNKLRFFSRVQMCPKS
jgi:hypothetical protein